MANEMLTPDDISQFRALFYKYCRGEADSCEYCPVNRAYEEIFDSLEDNDEED